MTGFVECPLNTGHLTFLSPHSLFKQPAIDQSILQSNKLAQACYGTKPGLAMKGSGAHFYLPHSSHAPCSLPTGLFRHSRKGTAGMTNMWVAILSGSCQGAALS